ncbi:hypothetical protein Tco_0968098 [Tanacetum coccineum]
MKMPLLHLLLCNILFAISTKCTIKTSSTKDTSSTFGTTSSLFESKPQSSLPTSNDTPSPKPSNPFLDNIMDAPLRPSHPLLLQSHPSLDITLSLSPITPLDHILDTLSPPSLQPQPQPPIMDFVMSDSKDSTVTYTAANTEDEVFLAEEQPLTVAVSPTADSPGYIADSDLEEDEDEEDPEEDPTDYPADGRDYDDDDDESFDDDEDDVKEEEHPTSADSIPPPVSPLPLPASPTYPLEYRADMIRQRAESPSTSHLLPLLPPIILSHTRESVAMMRAAAPSTYILASRSETPPSETPPLGTPPLLPIPLPTLSPHMLLSSTVCRAGVFEERPRERFWLWITNTWEDVIEDIHGTPVVTNVAELSQRMTDFVMTRDRRSYAYTALLMEREARLSCKAWGRSMDASDITRSEVRALRTTVLAQQMENAA